MKNCDKIVSRRPVIEERWRTPIKHLQTGVGQIGELGRKILWVGTEWRFSSLAKGRRDKKRTTSSSLQEEIWFTANSITKITWMFPGGKLHTPHFPQANRNRKAKFWQAQYSAFSLNMMLPDNHELCHLMWAYIRQKAALVPIPMINVYFLF